MYIPFFTKCIAACLLFFLMRSVSSAGVVAFWSFDEPSNPAIDSTANGPQNLTGDVERSFEIPVDPVPQTGQENFRSARFNGSQRLIHSDATQLDFAYSMPFTVEAWVRPTFATRPQTQFILEKRDLFNTFSQGYAVYITGAGNLGFTGVTTTGERFDLIASTMTSTDEWTHFSGVYDGNGHAAFYVDGTEVASTTDRLMGGTFENSSSFRVGQSLFPDKIQYEGLLDELRITNKKLPPARFLRATPVAVPEPSAFVFMGMVVIVVGMGERCRLALDGRDNVGNDF